MSELNNKRPGFQNPMSVREAPFAIRLVKRTEGTAWEE